MEKGKQWIKRENRFKNENIKERVSTQRPKEKINKMQKGREVKL
jgi:hypothetical protein